MTRKQKKMLWQIIIGACLLILAAVIPSEGIFRFVLFLIPYFVVGRKVLWKALRNIAHGQFFDENFLMSVTTIGAFCIGEYPEAVFVMLFYQIGELFQSYAVEQSRKSISSLMDIRPDYANIECDDGTLTQVDPEEVAIGSFITVKPGEKIPLDGVITDGRSSLDTAALTGEALPKDVSAGDAVISGCINQGGLLRICVNKSFGESTVSKILDLVENAAAKKSRSENFITKFSKYYTPIVVIAALLLALIPPLFFTADWSSWIERGLTFLVISCPCALVISVPLSFFCGIGAASKHGILVKGANYIEAMANIDTIVFDKTGTLTEGTFSVTAIHPDEISEAQLLEYAALAEFYSNHPISKSIQTAYLGSVDTDRISDYQEVAGHGVTAIIDGDKSTAVGNDKLMALVSADWRPCKKMGTIIHVAVNGIYAGHIVISDTLKPESKTAIDAFKANGVGEIVILTGDSERVGRQVADELGIQTVFAELLPGDKVQKTEALLNRKTKKGNLAFVGDGINDAPVLTRADIGIAMGAMGADAAIEAADVVLMDDNPRKILSAMNLSKKTLRIVKQNITFSLAVKAIVLSLGALGITDMWAAIFADVGVMTLAVLNAMRILKFNMD